MYECRHLRQIEALNDKSRSRKTLAEVGVCKYFMSVILRELALKSSKVQQYRLSLIYVK